jgi:profilin
MSWQAYIDNQLLATGKIAQAAIYGLNGSLWATSPGFSVSIHVQYRCF